MDDFKVGQQVTFRGTKGSDGRMLSAHPDGPDTFTATVSGYPYGICYALNWADGSPVGLPFAEHTLEAVPTRGGVVFCYYREARGRASRALKAAGITSVQYLSRASLESDGDHNPTPRYIFHGATAAQVEKLDAELGRDGEGTEMYSDRD